MTTKIKTKVFLADDYTFTAANNNLSIFGSTGLETLNILGYLPITEQILNGIEIDQNIETVNFSLSSGDYLFSQAGNALKVFDSSGEVLIATIPVQEDGTDLSFGDGAESFTMTLSNAAVMKIGDVVMGSEKITLSEPDNTPPATLIVSLAHDNGLSPTDKITNDATIALQNYEQGASIKYSLNGTDWVSNYKGMMWWIDGKTLWFTPNNLGVDGAKTIYVKQIDAAGNESAASKLEFTLDTTTLNVRLANDSGQSKTDKITNNPSLYVDNLKANATLQYSADGTTWLETKSNYIDGYSSVNAKLFKAGENTISVRQVDGTTTSPVTELKFTLDTTSPTGMNIRFDGIAGNTTNTTKPTFKITGAEAGTTLSYNYTVNDWRGNHWESAASLDGVTFAEGQNSINVIQTDTAGNSSQAYFWFTVDPKYVPPTPDTTAPAVLSVSLTNDNGVSSTDGITSNPSITLKNYENYADVKYSLNSTDGVNGDWNNVGSWGGGNNGTVSFTPNVGSGDAQKTIYVKQIDAAGNESAATKLEFTLDTTTLNVRLANDSGQSQTDKITNNPSLYVDNLKVNATLQYKVNDSEWLDTKSNYIEAYSSANAKLFKAGENTISVRQVDGTTTSEATSFTFTLDNTAPKTATLSITHPIQTNNGTFTRDGLVSVSNLEVGATVQYQLYANGQWQGTSSTTMPTPVEGNNQIYVYQTDIAGNQSNTGTSFNYMPSLNQSTTQQEPWTLLAKRSYYYTDHLTTSDGTTAGTKVSQDMYYATDIKTTSDETKAFLLQQSNSGSFNLVATNGVDTTIIKTNVNVDLYNQNNSLALDNGKIAFPLDNKTLLISDGTKIGTVESSVEILPSSLSSTIQDKAHGNYWFVANTAPYGQELGLLKIGADGKATSSIVKDINLGSGNFNYYSGWLGGALQGVVLNSGKLIFSANPDSTYDNNQLWVSDGTAEGTVKINYDAPANRAHYSYNFTAFGNKVLFTTQNSYGQAYIGVTDGTDANTHLISADTISNPTILKATADALYFTGTYLVDGVSKTSLFSTDGSTAVKMSDISGSAQFLAATPNHGFFVVSDATSGQELWVADKSDHSFHLVKDILTGSGAGLAGTNQGNVITVGDKILFPAYVNSNSTAYFISNGSEAGTIKISDDVPISSYLIGNTLVFANKTGVHSVDTSAATPSVSDLNSAANVVLEHDADQVFFQTASNDLYVATAQSAVKLASNVNQFKVLEENAIYFTETETINGNNTVKSLWYSDATTAGTHFVSYVDNNFTLDSATVIHTVGYPQV
jgi:ELWxxDGT repeat protein